MAVFHVGPLGQLVALPSAGLRTKVTVVEERIGGISTSLNGTRTRDTLAVKRKWTLGWPAATGQTRALLRALARPVWGPLRVLDPHEVNRLPADASAGGCETSSAAMFTATVGTVGWALVQDPPVGLPLRGAVTWERTTTSAGYLRVAYDEGRWRVPLMLSEQVCLSGYVRGPSAISVALGRESWNSAGVATSAQTTTTALDPVVWTRLELPYTPAAGRVSLSGFLHIAAAVPAGEIQTTGWQLNLGDSAVDWELGAGGPEVFVEITADKRLAGGLHELALELLEV